MNKLFNKRSISYPFFDGIYSGCHYRNTIYRTTCNLLVEMNLFLFFYKEKKNIWHKAQQCIWLLGSAPQHFPARMNTSKPKSHFRVFNSFHFNWPMNDLTQIDAVCSLPYAEVQLSHTIQGQQHSVTIWTCGAPWTWITGTFAAAVCHWGSFPSQREFVT